jgi:hypothetical protein
MKTNIALGEAPPVNAKESRSSPRVPQQRGDLRDLRSGTFDPGADAAAARGGDKTPAPTQHERDQTGASVRSEPDTPQPDSPIPEGLRRGLKRPHGPARRRSRGGR